MHSHDIVSPYAQNSLPQQDKLRVIDLFNRLDEKQSVQTGLDGNWMHKTDYKNIRFGSISLTGLRIASRLLKIRVSKPTVNWTENHGDNGAPNTPLLHHSDTASIPLCCAVAKATSKTVTLAGAYSIPSNSDFAEATAGIMAQRNAIRKVVPEDLLIKFLQSEKVYFAHPLTTFKTQQARDAVESIKKKDTSNNWIVIDPEIAVTSSGNQAMKDSLAIIRYCSCVVFITNGNSDISKGVFSEISYALNKRLPVRWLNNEGFIPITSLAQFDVHKHDFNHYAQLR